MGFRGPVKRNSHVKFVCYKEFDDPQEPILPGVFHKGQDAAAGARRRRRGGASARAG